MLLGQVMYKLCTKDRAPCTKETLPDFREEMSGHPIFMSFRGLTGSQRTPGNGASQHYRGSRQRGTSPHKM